MPKSKANSNGNSSNEIYQQIDSLSAIEKKVINSMQPFMDHEDFTAQVRTIMKAAGLLTDKVSSRTMTLIAELFASEDEDENEDDDEEIYIEDVDVAEDGNLNRCIENQEDKSVERESIQPNQDEIEFVDEIDYEIEDDEDGDEDNNEDDDEVEDDDYDDDEDDINGQRHDTEEEADDEQENSEIDSFIIQDDFHHLHSSSLNGDRFRSKFSKGDNLKYSASNQKHGDGKKYSRSSISDSRKSSDSKLYDQLRFTSSDVHCVLDEVGATIAKMKINDSIQRKNQSIQTVKHQNDVSTSYHNDIEGDEDDDDDDNNDDIHLKKEMYKYYQQQQRNSKQQNSTVVDCQSSSLSNNAIIQSIEDQSSLLSSNSKSRTQQSEIDNDEQLLIIDELMKNEWLKYKDSNIYLDNILYSNINSLLYGAATFGSLNFIKCLLQNPDIDINYRGPKNVTPLMKASGRGHEEIVELLIDNGADCNLQSSKGTTALMEAAYNGHLETVKVLCEKGSSCVEMRNENGHTALMEAATSGHVEIAKYFISNGADINVHSNEFRESALTLAAYRGHLEMVQYLVELKADSSDRAEEMHTALMEASMDGHVEVARFLLDSGAQVNMPPNSFESPLTLAACGGHVELALLLLMRGANIEEVNDEGYNALMEASREKHEEMVALLIAHGANVNAIVEESKETALLLACCSGSIEVVNLLIKAGADVNLGATPPLIEASQEGHYEIVKLLLDNGADINITYHTGETALDFACGHNHLNIVKLLIEYGADIDHMGNDGRTPLLTALRAANKNIITYLVCSKADVNLTTPSNDQTPLSIACANGDPEIVELLLCAGANINHQLKDNRTALMEAALNGHTDIIELLLRYSQVCKSKTIVPASNQFVMKNVATSTSAAVPKNFSNEDNFVHLSKKSKSSRKSSKYLSDQLSVDKQIDAIGGNRELNEIFSEEEYDDGDGDCDEDECDDDDNDDENNVDIDVEDDDDYDDEQETNRENGNEEEFDYADLEILLNKYRSQEEWIIEKMAQSKDPEQAQREIMKFINQIQVRLMSKMAGNNQAMIDDKNLTAPPSSPQPPPSRSKISLNEFSEQWDSLINEISTTFPNDIFNEVPKLRKIPALDDRRTYDLIHQFKSQLDMYGVERTDFYGQMLGSMFCSIFHSFLQPTEIEADEIVFSEMRKIIFKIGSSHLLSFDTRAWLDIKVKLFEIYKRYVLNYKKKTQQAFENSDLCLKLEKIDRKIFYDLIIFNKIIMFDENEPMIPGFFFKKFVKNNMLLNFFDFPAKLSKKLEELFEHEKISMKDCFRLLLSSTNVANSSMIMKKINDQLKNQSKSHQFDTYKINPERMIFSRCGSNFLPIGYLDETLFKLFYKLTIFFLSEKKEVLIDELSQIIKRSSLLLTIVRPLLLMINYRLQQNESVVNENMESILKIQNDAKQFHKESLENDELDEMIKIDKTYSSDETNGIDDKSFSNSFTLERVISMKNQVDASALFSAFTSDFQIPKIPVSSSSSSSVSSSAATSEKGISNDDSFNEIDSLAITQARRTKNISNRLESTISSNCSDALVDIINAIPSSAINYNNKIIFFREKLNTLGLLESDIRELLCLIDEIDMFSPTEKCKTQASKTKQVVEQSTSLENRDSEMIQEPSSIVGHSNSITPQNRFYHLHHPPPPPPPPPFQAIKSRTTSKVSNAKKAKKIRSQNSSSTAKKIRNMLAQSTTSLDENDLPIYITEKLFEHGTELVDSFVQIPEDDNDDDDAENDHDDEREREETLIDFSKSSKTIFAIPKSDKNLNLLNETKKSRISLAKKDPSKYAKNSVNSKLKSFESSITAKTKLPTVDLNSSTESNHDTALLLACSNGHDDAVKCLINKGADIEHKNKKGLTPLIVAAANGHVSIIEILLNHGAELESLTDVSKDTALSVACSLGQIKAVELLLCRGANKEHRNISDYTPLSLASAAGHTEIADILCRHGAEINLRTGSKLGITPLMLASMNGHIETVKLLLDRGSDINAYVETNRNTALTLAAFQGRHDVVDLLADRNANIEHRAKTGLTPLMEAASSGYTEVGKVLLEKGAEVNAAPVPATRDTALTLAADKGYAKFVEVLIINGANVDAKNKKGYSALWLACNGGHLDVVNLLIQAKCEVDAQDNRKVSCLMAAFRKGHVKVVKLMVSHVAQFPSDQETNRYIDICSDEELKKKVIACAGIIRFAKDRQAAEALKNATNLLEEIDMERSRQESKKAAAARKRERKKQKKKEKAEQNQQQQQKSHTEIDDNGNFKESNFSTDIEKNEIFKNPQEENDESIKSNNRNEEEDVNPKITIKKSKTLINQNKQSSDTKPTADQNSGTSENEDKTIQKKLQDQSFEKNERSKLKNIKSIVDSGVMKFSISKNRNRDLEISASEKHPKIRIVTDSSTKHQSMIFNDCNHNSSQAGTRRVDQPQSKIRLSFQNKNEKSVESDISHQTNKISDQIVNHMNHAKNSRGTKTFTNKRYEAQMSSNNYSNNPAINKSTAIEFTKRDEGWKEVVRKSKRVLVPGNAISRVIGRSGCNINTIREVSGAHIEVEKQKGQGDRNVIIRGSAEATRIASQLITVLSQEADKDLSEIMENLGISKHPPSAELSPDNSSNEDAFSFSKTVSENSLQVSVAQSVAQKNYRQITSKCFSKSATTNESVANKSSPRSQSLEISTFKDDLNSVTQTSATSNTVSYTMAVNSKIRSTNSSSSTATNMNGNTNVKIMSTIFKPSNKSLLYSNRNPNIRSKQSKETTSNFESSVESHNYNYNLVSEKNFTSEIDGKHSAGAASIQSNEFDASMSLNESLDQFANEKNRFSDVTASGIITSTSSVNTITHLLMQQLSQPILSKNQNLSSKSTDDNETLRSLVSPIYSAHSNSSQPSCPTSSLLINTSSTSTANHIVSNLNYSGHVRSAPCTPPISNYSPSIKSNLNQASNLLNERISPFSINPNLLMKSTTNSLDNHESVATAAATEYGPIHPSMFASSTSSNTDFLVNNSDLLYNNNQLRNQINNMGDANHNLFLDQRSLTPTLFNSEASNNLKRSGLNPNAPDYASRSNSFSAIPPQHSLGPGGTINFNQSNMNYSNSVSSFTLNTMINGLSCTGQNRSNYSPNNNPPPMSNDVRQMILNYSMNIFQNNVPKQHQEAAARLAHLSAQNNNFAVNNDHLHGNVFASKPISKKLNYFPYVAPNEMKSSQLNSLDSFSMQTQLINNQNQFKLAAANNTSCIGPTSSVNTELFDFFNSTQNTYDLTMKTPPSLDSPDSRQEDGNAKINKQPAPIGTERAQRKHPASCGQMSTTPNTINNDNPMFMDQTNSWRLNYDDVNEAVNGESNLNQSSLSFNASLNDTSNFADPIFPSATDQSLSGFYNPMSFANQQQQQPQQKCGIKLLNEALTNLDHFNSMSDNIILNSGDISANHLNDWQTDPIVLKTNNNLIVPSIPTHPLSVSGTNEFDSYKMWGSNNWSNQI